MVRIDVCTGTVYFRAFSRFTVSCHLRYEWYPFDEQAKLLKPIEYHMS